jgi:heat shock protein HslJ
MKGTVLDRILQVCVVSAIAIGMAAQSSNHKAAAPLVKTEWKLIWLAGAKMETATPHQVPYFQLDPASQRVSGSGGCNRLMGGYELSGANLRFTQMAITRMACLHGGNEESSFVQALNEVKAWKIVGGRLLLMDEGSRVVAKFSAVTPED